MGLVLNEHGIEDAFLARLKGLKYSHRPDITDRASLEANFREKFEALNRCKLTDAEFARLLDEIVSADVFTAAKTLRSINSFTRTLLCFLQLFIVSNRDRAYYFANNNARHFAGTALALAA